MSVDPDLSTAAPEAVEPVTIERLAERSGTTARWSSSIWPAGRRSGTWDAR